MNKIRGKRFDVVRLLEDSEDLQGTVDELVAREGRDTVIAQLKRALGEPDDWPSEASPVAIADALAWLGELQFLVDALKESAGLFDEAIDGGSFDVEEDAVVNACVTALGSAGSKAVDVVIAGIVEGSAKLSLIEVLAALGEGGAKDERSWALIAGLFDTDVLYACAYAHAYGDPRGVPLLHKVVDDAKPTVFDIDNFEADDDANDVIHAAVDALDSFGAVRDSDREKLAEVEKLDL